MTYSSRELFDNYQSNYERRGQGYFRSLADVQQLHLERLPRWLDRVKKDARILDAGCATGYLLGLLHALGYQHLTGVDISRQLISCARDRLPETVNLHCMDVRDFLAQTSDGAYDLILFHHVLEHIPRKHTIGLLLEFRRCLAPGGLLSLKTPNAACLYGGLHGFGDFTHVVQFNELSMIQVLEQAGFGADDVELVLHPPRLFWSWRYPHRAVLRMLNRFRWHINAGLHAALGLLADVRPRLRCHEWELEVLVKR